MSQHEIRSGKGSTEASVPRALLRRLLLPAGAGQLEPVGQVPSGAQGGERGQQEAGGEVAQTISAHLDGGGVLDASLLALPLRAVIPANHPRMVATTSAIADRLSAGDGLPRARA